MQKKFSWVVFGILVALPLFVVASTLVYCVIYGFTWIDFLIIVFSYYLCNISVGIGYHRLWSHGSFKASAVLEFVLMLLTAATLQGPVLAWASDHRRHHAHTDKEGDPHSPYFNLGGGLKGFFWSHIGWMLFCGDSVKHLDKFTVKKFGRNKILKFQMKYYWYLALFMNMVIPPVLGFYFGGLHGAFAGFALFGLGRAIQQQATFCINSVAHFFGSKNYSEVSARDVWWMAPFLLGENYHSFHHAFSRDYRNGHRWYHLDVHKWIIYLLSKVGLAYDLVVTPSERIEAKRNEIVSASNVCFVDRLSCVESSASKIASVVRVRIEELEKSANAVMGDLYARLLHVESTALYIAAYAKKVALDADSLSERVVANVVNQFRSLEVLQKNL